MRIRVLLHNTRFTIVGSRLRIEIPQILSDIFSLSQVADRSSDSGVFAHELLLLALLQV